MNRRPSNAYSATVTEDDVCSVVSCEPGVAKHVAAVRPCADAGFTHVALVGVGAGKQGEFISWASKELLPALRELC